MWRVLEPFDDEVAMGPQNRFAVTAQLAKRDSSGRSITLRPPNNRRNRNDDTRRNQATAPTQQNNRNNPFSQIVGKKRCHSMLTYCSSLHLELQLS